MCPHGRHRLRSLVLQALVEVDGGGVGTGLSYCFLQIRFQAAHAHRATNRRWNIIPKWTKLLITSHTSVTSSIPLLREESAAKRGCKHQAKEGGKKERGMLQMTRLKRRDVVIFPLLTTDPQAPLELERLKLGIAAKTRQQRAQLAVNKTGTKYQNK